MSTNLIIPILLTLAWLAPLVGMVVAWTAGRLAISRRSRLPAWCAIGAMGVSLNLALAALVVWWWKSPDAPAAGPSPISGVFYEAGAFGSLALALEYYIDGLTLLMFAVVTTISTAVHVFAVAYMREGLPDDDWEEAIEAEGENLTPLQAIHDAQPTLYSPQLPRFFALLQFFTFAMLGLILAGNLLQMFVFWELVGAASYLLIGFHFERPYAAVAATKAFVMNRIGDAGFLIGMMILWTAFGTLTFGERFSPPVAANSEESLLGETETIHPGLFALAEHELSGDGGAAVADTWRSLAVDSAVAASDRESPRWWLVAAGLLLFAGCVGKSAQLPLATWLPDAMAGPTPVSALVHSATMVAAGVYLIGRMYVVFLPDVLLVIAYVGAATLVYGATCAVFQTDLKRILAYSTISQLGYMMLALGVGGREAGLFHLVTHAFFKSLLFLAAGSVIVACHHVQDLSQMGGLRKKMPLTAYTALVGVIAIGGLAVPWVHVFGEPVAFSGYHSKDSILAAALHYTEKHPEHSLLFIVPLLTAGLTAFYMFRFWLLAFAGAPRDPQVHKHAREGSPMLTWPLVVLAVLAAFVAIGGETGILFRLLGDSPEGALAVAHGQAHETAAFWGLVLGLSGTFAALLFYGLRDVRLQPAEMSPVQQRFFVFGWHLDRLYDHLIVKPLRGLAAIAAWCDQKLLDGFLHGFSRFVVSVARAERFVDERIVDGLVNWLADTTYALGQSLRMVQTGQLRQYVVALAVAAVALFALAMLLLPRITFST